MKELPAPSFGLKSFTLNFQTEYREGYTVEYMVFAEGWGTFRLLSHKTGKVAQLDMDPSDLPDLLRVLQKASTMLLSGEGDT